MGPPLLKIHHPLDNVCPGAKVMRRGDPFSIESILRLYRRNTNFAKKHYFAW